jgi:hypothetical protein
MRLFETESIWDKDTGEWLETYFVDGEDKINKKVSKIFVDYGFSIIYLDGVNYGIDCEPCKPIFKQA